MPGQLTTGCGTLNYTPSSTLEGTEGKVWKEVRARGRSGRDEKNGRGGMEGVMDGVKGGRVKEVLAEEMVRNGRKVQGGRSGREEDT